jgi:hypothetical protein
MINAVIHAHDRRAGFVSDAGVALVSFATLSGAFLAAQTRFVRLCDVLWALWVRASRLIAAMLLSAAFSVSCSRHPTASVRAETAHPADEQAKQSKAFQEAEQAATYELIRLRSAYQARATAADFSDRVVNAQVNITSGMTHVSDAEFRNIATRAVGAYAKVRENWELRINFEKMATKHPNFYAQNNQDADYYKSMEALYIVRAYDLTKLAESYVNAKTAADRAQLLKNAVEADKIFENQWEKKSKAREKVLADRKRAQEESAAEWKGENDERPRPFNEEMAEQAEVERKRRFAPEGTVYNLKPVKLASGKQTVIASAESTLNVVRKNADGSVHVELNGAEADVPADDLTNDRDWLAAYRILHRDDN